MRYEPQQPRAAEPQPASMNLAAVYLSGWRRMFDYGGTSSRTEYWVWGLITWVLLTVIGLVAEAPFFETGATAWLAPIVVGVCSLVAFMAWLPLQIRRVRDATSSGWFTFLFLVFPPLLIGIALCPRYVRDRLDALPGGYWDVWRRSADYLGLATRSEFWQFTLINLVMAVSITLAVIVLPALVARDAFYPRDPIFPWWICAPFFVLTGMAFVLAVPGTAVLVRRVRDATGSGWVALVGLLPFGGLALLVITILPGRQQPGTTPESVAQRTPIPEQREEADPWARGQGGGSGSAE